MSSHTATFTKHKTNGGYLVRLQGPHAEDAAGHEVPVSFKSGRTQVEKLTRLVWAGLDDQEFPNHPATGEPVALYEFEQTPKAKKPFEF